MTSGVAGGWRRSAQPASGSARALLGEVSGVRAKVSLLRAKVRASAAEAKAAVRWRRRERGPGGGGWAPRRMSVSVMSYGSQGTGALGGARRREKGRPPPGGRAGVA
ncbi:hypothetical protein GCM10010486_55520 [Nonomuraea roseoviolacea subsp. carminata]